MLDRRGNVPLNLLPWYSDWSGVGWTTIARVAGGSRTRHNLHVLPTKLQGGKREVDIHVIFGTVTCHILRTGSDRRYALRSGGLTRHMRIVNHKHVLGPSQSDAGEIPEHDRRSGGPFLGSIIRSSQCSVWGIAHTTYHVQHDNDIRPSIITPEQLFRDTLVYSTLQAVIADQWRPPSKVC